MNTMAIPDTATTVTRLVRRPAPRGESPADTVGTLIKMPPRRTVAADQATGTLKDTAGQAQDRHSAGRRDCGEPTALDPGKSERALVTEMTRRIALAALEVLWGVRSVQQLSRWLDTRCYSALTTRARLHAAACQREDRHLSHDDSTVATLHHQPMVHSIHCFPVRPGIYETTVVVADKTHFRAIAMRLEESRGAWKVTALRIG